MSAMMLDTTRRAECVVLFFARITSFAFDRVGVNPKQLIALAAFARLSDELASRIEYRILAHVFVCVSETISPLLTD